MFERKNQNIPSEHYSKLISHDDSGNSSGSEQEFITLKRADHGLSDDDGGDGDREDDEGPAVKEGPKSKSQAISDDDDKPNLSKCKLKLGRAKRTIAKGGIATKLVFDDDGEAHELY
jgi:ATP-dependent RNA helicase DDX10/DBP4